MERPKAPVKIVHSKKLPADFGMPLRPQLHKKEVDKER
jgi:hypothetical protein